MCAVSITKKERKDSENLLGVALNGSTAEFLPLNDCIADFPNNNRHC